MTIRIQPVTCPHCGTTLAGRAGRRAPQQGDASMCWRCRRISILAMTPAGFMLREPTSEELSALVARDDFADFFAATKTGGSPQEAEMIFRYGQQARPARPEYP